jgi:phenylacetate-CoA ligase
LQEAIKTHLGISTEIEINEPSALARSQGKAVHVFDRRKA